MAQKWKTDRYAEHAPFVPLLGESLVDLLNPQPGERILDVGCGDGVLFEKIRQAGAAVVGVDDSPDMVEAAKRHGIDARLIDACDLPFDAQFDAAFSNAALHWMKRDPDAVLAAVRRALKPGGRFAAELGGHGNIAAIKVALLAVLTRHGVKSAACSSPWYFPTADEYRRKLERAGFRVDSIELIPRPVILPTDMRGWLESLRVRFSASFRSRSVLALLTKLLNCSARHFATPNIAGRSITYVSVFWPARDKSRGRVTSKPQSACWKRNLQKS